ncbi:hypothetical protein DAEQUDRAFT_346883 [Daedalea quercina L-15889]|uniref:Uncharacterized protein n=1 Tax=Daedalea quercina L-15889 TaxID=1314783 RepID=A0A165PCB7_9APHY|nr:hypothetical protein DAEQUDRAFT_346883 [Daedalea quercina L-15889]
MTQWEFNHHPPCLIICFLRNRDIQSRAISLPPPVVLGPMRKLRKAVGMFGTYLLLYVVRPVVTSSNFSGDAEENEVVEILSTMDSSIHEMRMNNHKVIFFRTLKLVAKLKESASSFRVHSICRLFMHPGRINLTCSVGIRA